MSKQVDGFRVLCVKYKESSNIIRHLLIKEHKLRESSEAKPVGKTLFVINLPPFVDEKCIHHLFDDCGQITDIFFHSRPTSSAPALNESKYFPDKSTIKDDEFGYKVCYVVFKKEASLEKALNLKSSKESPKIISPNHGHCVGLELYKKRYNDNIVNTQELQQDIDSFMKKYDDKVEEEKLIAKQKANEPDDEGWITVSRHGNKSYLANKEWTDEKIADKQKKKTNKEKKELKNFYSFQVKEGKMERLTQLRKKFEEDKKRIAIMKASRKFKPF